jgi:hypothetical protein
MSRSTVAALLVVLLAALGLAAPAASPAKTRTCRTAKGKVVHYRGAKRPTRCVKVKPKRTPAKAPAAPAPGTDAGPAGSPVALDVRPGSNVTLDLGAGRIRTFPLEGRLRGYLVGKYQPGVDTTFTLTRGTLAVGPTDTLMDDCPAPALARTNPATVVTLDPGKESPLTVSADGAVRLRINMIVRVVLDLRSEAGCGGPATTSGYADTAGAVPLGGTIDADLSPFTLTSNLFPLRLNACYVPGPPASQCQFAPTGLQSTAGVRLAVDLQVG